MSTVNPRLKEALEAAAKAEVSNRGIYNWTIGSNVFKSDGTSILDDDTDPDPDPETSVTLLEV